MVFERVTQMLGENTDENTTFEPLKKPVDKEKSRAFGSAHPIWLALEDDFRTIDWATEYPYPSIALKEIQDLLAV